MGLIFVGLRLKGFFFFFAFIQQIYIASNQPNPFSPYSIICTFTSALANICSPSYELEY